MYRRLLPLLLLIVFLFPFTMQSAPASALLIIQNIGQAPAAVRYQVLGGSHPG
jgi:hypothetical protein